MDVKKKEVKIDNEVYVIQEYGTAGEVEIRNYSLEIELPKKRGEKVKQKMLFGDLQVATVMVGLASWTLKDASGKTADITFENVKNLMPKGHLDTLYAEIENLNTMSEEEKKS